MGGRVQRHDRCVRGLAGVRCGFQDFRKKRGKRGGGWWGWVGGWVGKGWIFKVIFWGFFWVFYGFWVFSGSFLGFCAAVDGRGELVGRLLV